MTPDTEPQRLCTHFGACGGCTAQDVPYTKQLEAKAEVLRGLLGSYWPGPIEVVPSPVQWHYRNKVDPTFGRMFFDEPPPKGTARPTVLGFKRKGKWFWTLDLQECLIAPAGMDSLLRAVVDWARESGLEPFDTRRQQGFLRHLLVREGKGTGERMVVLITSEGAFDGAAFADAVATAWPEARILRAVNRGGAEVAIGDVSDVYAGPAYIDEVLHVGGNAAAAPIRFRLTPFSFFQTNSLATERLYGIIRDGLAAAAPQRLYDLYGGSGGIALSCAAMAETVVSVESFAPASADGRVNAALNGVDHIEFITQPVEAYLRDRAGQGGFPDGAAVVLDPPRAGLHPKALKCLLELRPRDIIYVSCKPSVFAEELDALRAVYSVDSLQAVDLFPHTPHVEVVAKLRRD